MNALIIDTQELFRLTLKEVVSMTTPFKKIIEATSEQEFLTLTAQETDIDLILLTPHQLGKDGTKWLHLARRLFPSASILSFYNRDNPASLRHSDKKCEMLPRDASVKQTITSLRRLMNLPQIQSRTMIGERPTPNVMGAMNGSGPNNAPSMQRSIPELSRLSFRQRQILAMAADGLPNKEIAARLEIAEGTVKAHMHAIFKVLGVTNRTQAVLQYAGNRHNTQPDQAMAYAAG